MVKLEFYNSYFKLVKKIGQNVGSKIGPLLVVIPLNNKTGLEKRPSRRISPTLVNFIKKRGASVFAAPKPADGLK